MKPPIYLVFFPMYTISAKSNNLLLRGEISTYVIVVFLELIKIFFRKVFIIFLKVV